ncbi:unnamed protein product, partial [Vitis vinifera]
MLLISKTTPNLWVSPPHQIHRENSLTYPNGFIFFRPSSKTPLVSSNLYHSCATIGTSVLPSETIDCKITDYNIEICRFCELGNLRRAMELINQSPKPDLELRTYCSVLQLCADLKSIQDGRRIHSIIQSNDVEVDGVLGSKLVFMYVTCGDLREGRRIFDKVANEKVFLWNLLMNGYAKIGNFRESLSLFKRMRELGIRRVESARKLFDELGDRDVISWNSMISGYVSNGLSEKGLDLFEQMLLLGINTDLATMVSVELTLNNCLLDMYSKSGNLNSAIQVFETMGERSVVSWTSMIAGYAREGLSDMSVRLFHEMEKEDLFPNSITMACILPACASLAALERGQEIHGHILRNGFSLDRHVANALVDMYLKCGALGLARLLFDMIPEKDLVSWTVMIAGYGMHGYGSEAIAAFNEMRNSGIEPDEVSFISILYACSHSGLLDEGWGFFNMMRNNCCIEPKSEHYACIVDLLARAGNLSKAYKFIKMMPIEPDATIWGALLCGCRIYHDVKLAEKVAEHVFELEPENTGYYVLLANIYAEAEKWEEVKKLRERIGRRGLRKNPGCSWIEIKGKVHIFVTGDSSHPLANKIELLLKKTRTRMKEEGHFPKMRYALIKADDTEKEMALCGHSEKIAMAFGILSLPPGKTVRVTKNLRVCGDCHEMAKFMSKMVKRDIILRDSNRFHHFKDGSCSCRGHW